jgi:hypothetical protein
MGNLPTDHVVPAAPAAPAASAASNGVNVQHLFAKNERGELPGQPPPPALPEGTYRLTVTSAVAGDTYINVFMSTDDGQPTRVRMFLTGQAASVTTQSLNGMGINSANTPQSLHELAAMLVGRVLEAKLRQWKGDSYTYQNMVPSSVNLVDAPQSVVEE